ncbi:MAG: FG-GAP repeat protein [Candidatus Hydrogenedentes bacterium ADurb.Bin101]|jgi:hypothetical protein|nr:MAG: FG-GAP repeat protein [Candidatus Hydrogenedentes bacterium ADurb.Bin101]HOC67249.1 VCBS repeat-containing protein [Candidatus Hydrogenedentota bacterium]
MNGYFVLAVALWAQVEAGVYTVGTGQPVWDVSVTDMNGDGLGDVLLLTNDETAFPPRKQLAVCMAEVSGAYGREPAPLLDLPVETGVVFAAEVDGQSPREIVAAHGTGATVYQFAGGRFSVLETVRFNALYPTNSREPCFAKWGAVDLQGDGIEEWLLPVAGGVQVRTLTREVAFLSCDVVSEMRSGDSLYIIHRLPDFVSFTLEGRQALGLAFLSDEFADFAYGDAWSQQKRVRLPMNLEEKWDASASMKDINGNGFPDIVITQTRGTVRMYAETHVYLAREPFVYPEKPDAVFSASGAVSSPLVMDVNGDERLDLIFIRIPFGVKNLVNFFVRGKLAVQAEVHLFDGEKFNQEADYHTSMSMDAPEGRERVAYTFGDFSGDGRLDVAYGSKSDTLAVYTGDPERFIGSRPWQEFKMPAFGTARAYDLNHNKARDMVLFRPGGDNARRVDILVF